MPRSEMVAPATTAIPVVDVDVAAPLPPVAGPDGGRGGSRAFLLVRCHTEPVGTLVVDVPETSLSATDLGAAIEARYGEVLAPRRASPSPYLAGRAKALAAAPPLTVVICTRDRPRSLARALGSVRVQSWPPERVLVVDSAGDDGRAAGVAAQHGAEYLRVDGPGLARARNVAVRATAGSAVAWLDDDEIADEHWLAEGARALVEVPAADVVCGAVLPAELRTAAQVWFEELGGMVKGRGFDPETFGPATRSSFHPLFPLPPVGAGANMVTRAGTVERVGGFDPALGAGTPARSAEDTMLFARVLRAGGTVAYRPSVLTRHFHRETAEALEQQLRGYGTGLTAMYTALVRERPATVLALVALAPRAVGVLLGQRAGCPRFGHPVPPQLRRAIRGGMFSGPGAYLAGRRLLP